MYNQDEQGRRRSARNLGLPPSSSPPHTQIDLLTDDHHQPSNSNEATNAATPTSNNSTQRSNAESYDLLSFDPIDQQESDDHTNSSHFLSSTSSPLYDNFWHRPHQNYTYPPPNWTPTPHQNTNLNPTIIELQNTIRLLNNRLGMLESTPPPLHITSVEASAQLPPTPTINLSPAPPITKIAKLPQQQEPTKKQDPPDSTSIVASTPDNTLTPSNSNQNAPDPPDDEPVVTATIPKAKAIPVLATITTDAMALKTPYTAPTITTPDPTITQTSTTPHSTNNTTQSIPTPSLQNVIYTKEHKLTLSTYKPSMDYSHWKALCLLEAANNSTFKNIVTKYGNKYILNQYMTDHESSTLYLATMKALGSHAFNIISITDTETADGLELWSTMDDHFNEREESFLLKHDIKCKFLTLSRNPTEAIDNYRIRFEKQLHLMTINNIAMPSRLELVFQFLNQMKIKRVFDEIIMKMDTDTSFFSGLNWKQLSQKSSKQIQLYQKIHPNVDVFNTKPRNPTKPTNPKPPPPNKPDQSKKKKYNNQHQDSPSPESPMPKAAVHQAEVDKIRNILKTETNPKYQLHCLHVEHPHNCPIHNGKPHPLLSCTILCRVCEDLDLSLTLEHVQRTLNIKPYVPEYRRKSNPDTATWNDKSTPTPPSRPSPSTPVQQARRVTEESTNDITDKEYYDHANKYESLAESDSSTENSELTSNNDITHYPISILRHCSHLSLSNNTNRHVTFHPNTKSTSTSSFAVATQPPTQITNPLFPTNLIRMVIDSGASAHMSSAKNMFQSITYFPLKHQPRVTMGDDKTQLPIAGHGFITFMLHGKHVRVHALYVPHMGNTALFSVKQHMKNQGCYFHAESQKCQLAFPSFIVSPRVDDEIEVIIKPTTISTVKYDFNEDQTTKLAIANPVSTLITYPDISTFNVLSANKQPYLPKSSYPSYTECIAIKKLLPSAQIPSQATKGSIGFDVTAITPTTINPGEIASIPTGLATALPQGMYIRIAPRSSMSLQHLTIEGGVVDSDYRGEIKILIKNNNTTPFSIIPQQKIAQFIFERASVPHINIVPTLPPTQRNKGGFGSTTPYNNKRTKTFRLNDNELLLMTKLSHRHRIRRINNPIQTIPPLPTDATVTSDQPDPLTSSKSKPNKTSSNKPVEKQFSNKEQQIIQHHLYSPSQDTTVDAVFNMQQEPISPLPHNQHCPKSSTYIPTPLAVDSVNASLPKVTTMPQHMLQRSIGHLNTDLLQKHIHTLGTKSLQIQRINQQVPLDPGDTATMPSKRRNTTPSSKPKAYSDTWHADIGFGPCAAIGGIRYTLMLVDKFSRFKLVYGLKNLTSSLLTAMKQFVIDAGKQPVLIRTDFDQKIIGGKVQDFLQSKGIKIQASPPYRQHQNGLVERHWKTVVSMARNWLTSQLLPSKYWYFAVKRACEVQNILPIKHDDKITTPYELVYHKKVDYRVLFPLFTVAYIKHMRDEGKALSKWKGQSLKCIVVGSCTKSDALLFYHPPSKQLLSCADGYTFDTYSPSGPQFNEKFDGDFIFNIKSDYKYHHLKPTHATNDTVYVKGSNDSYFEATILAPPDSSDNPIYTVQCTDTDDIIQITPEEICDHNPNSLPTDDNSTSMFPHLPWLKTNAKVTMCVPNLMPKPKQGFLQHKNNEWYFLPGRKKNKDPIMLPDFTQTAESMVTNKHLFKGWKPHSVVSTARVARATSNIISNLIVNRKVSAKDLHLMTAPTLLKHHQLHADDRKTWDEAYRQEYQGLVDIDTWETITETEYEDTKHLYKGVMPTMAISTIKYDGSGAPIRAKYRIVALGNLDPHNWTKNDCFAPVLSHFELRFLTALAAQKKRIPKTGDVSQAFCQSSLPAGENYVCRPPAGCPITPPNIYWRLKKTLYGLRRSPRHFYNLAKKTLEDIGLTQHPTSPCLFFGTLIQGHPPLYLGLYVDDFIYFSESDAVENKFEEEFGQKLDTDFNGKIGYFLGINFTHDVSPSGDVTIMMSQEAFVDNLVQMANLADASVYEPKTPYRSGFPVDSIPHKPPTLAQDQAKLCHTMQTYLGCLNWLAISTRPDIATITNLLAKYTASPSPGHLTHVKHVIRYLKGTKSKGICFSTNPNSKIESFVKFPIDPSTVTSMCDANWGPQDQSKPRENENRQLDLFKTRSLSGFIIFLGGPVHWVSKRQTITARSSAEAEIYAVDECTKALLHLSYIIDGLALRASYMPAPTTVYNDNSACVKWSTNTTTKGLRHIQIRENAVRESCVNGFIVVEHISGKLNLSDMFTKEDKDVQHFLNLRDHVVVDPLDPNRHLIDFSRNRRVTICANNSPSYKGGCQLGTCIDGQTSPNIAYLQLSYRSQ
jgi:deoxyuridine 5'-triphosphate nucleotidohydrolase